MIEQENEQLTMPPDGRPPEKQPRWRQDFPIDWPQDEYISRREFVKFLLLTSAAFTAGQFWFLAQNLLRQRADRQPVQEIARVEDIPIGGTLIFKYPEDSPARLLVRVDEEIFVAYEQQCTHLTCPVIPEVEAGELHCPCHEGVFDLFTGRPLAGPPRRPLARITLDLRDGRVFATGIEERTR
ncbi:MAG: Rieske (2Fe-2S) protein [Chloroflexi bacterium]|nr:Rieske (2Fe-2S) protein [Chloroflexota bacterium]MCI0575470.1 Rieske (2Fe-2S) protein [Chloroflexota bacterium]MCI0648907.1 Rieske (2Fe-2S) protein [Chloroflexota bacterium]MCI0731117.1 Rieske (2Fe-2S) protein [Chloroflexota bacterium]